MSMIIFARLLANAQTVGRITRSGLRFISLQNTPEAFLEPAASVPGVQYLSLNRPQSKNAISVRLLKVNGVPMEPCESAQIIIGV